MGWTESVYLDCVAPDGATGMIARLARHVDDGTAWLWAHVFAPGGIVAFHSQELPCAGGPTAVEDPDARYVLPGSPGSAGASFRRHGPRGEMTGATVEVAVRGHRDAYAPAGPGPVTLRVDATFEPLRSAGGTLPGRTEVLGRVTARIDVDGRRMHVEALGQWHEQHQTAPRFRTPFTYGTLRGARTGAVLVCGPQRSGALVWRDDAAGTAVAVDIDGRGPVRRVTFHLDGGEEVHGSLRTVHDYAVTIDGTPRPGTLVTGDLGGHPVSGCVNDFVPAPSPARP